MSHEKETTVMITVPGDVAGHVVQTWMDDKELALVNKAVEFLERVDNDDRLRVGIYWPCVFKVSAKIGTQPIINPYDTELFVYADHIAFGYVCDGPRESAHLSIEALRRLFANSLIDGSGDGYGSGSGLDYGCGYGSGSGSGFGSGFGCGSGFGSGSGSGKESGVMT